MGGVKLPEQTCGDRDRRPLSGRRPSGRGPRGRPIAAAIVLMASLGVVSCRRGGDEGADRTPPAVANDAAPAAGAEAPQAGPGPDEPGSGGLTPEQKARAEQLINRFEHGTTDDLYGSAEALPDGRGITFCRAGFTTQSGDGLELIRRYTSTKPESPLARYLPRLEELARDRSGSTDGLDGFIEAVHRAADDPTFHEAQDELQDELYYRPSMKIGDSLGLRTALARAAIYDAMLMHGAGDDPDGLPALIERAREEAGGTPATGVDEADWLAAFLRVRREDLAHAHNPETRAVWARSVGRVDVFRTLADQGNLELHGPVVLKGEYAGVIP